MMIDGRVRAVWFVLSLNLFILFVGSALSPVYADSSYLLYEDENPNYWTNGQWGVGAWGLTVSDNSTNVYSGSYSTFLRLAGGSYSGLAFYHVYAAVNFADFDTLRLWWYSPNASSLQWINIYCLVDGANYYYWQFKESWLGWRELSFPWTTALISGSPSWSGVVKLQVTFTGLTARYLLVDHVSLVDWDATSEASVLSSGWMSLVVLLALVFSCLLLCVKRVPLVAFPLGLFSLLIGVLVVNSSDVPFQPYFSAVVCLVGVLTVFVNALNWRG